jgi:hypothetical protein
MDRLAEEAYFLFLQYDYNRQKRSAATHACCIAPTAGDFLTGVAKHPLSKNTPQHEGKEQSCNL